LSSVQLATLMQKRLGSAIDPFDVSFNSKHVLVNTTEQPDLAEPTYVVINGDGDADLKKKLRKTRGT
jgi:hypothetical protein